MFIKTILAGVVEGQGLCVYIDKDRRGLCWWRHSDIDGSEVHPAGIDGGNGVDSAASNSFSHTSDLARRPVLSVRAIVQPLGQLCAHHTVGQLTTTGVAEVEKDSGCPV